MRGVEGRDWQISMKGTRVLLGTAWIWRGVALNELRYCVQD